MNPHNLYTSSCLICNDSDTILTTTKPEIINNRSKISNELMINNQVINDLQVIFVLRNILEIPSEQLENYLVKWGSPCSGEWIKICSVCWHAVENVMRIYQEIVESTVIFKRVKNEIIRKIRRSSKNITSIKIAKSMKEISVNSRLFVLNHDYGPSEDPFISGDLMASQKLSKVQDVDVDPVGHQSQIQQETEGEPDDEFSENYDDTSRPDSPINQDFEEEPISIKTEQHNSSVSPGAYHSDGNLNETESEEASDPELEEPVTTDINYEEDPLSVYLRLATTPTPSSSKAAVKTPPKSQTATHSNSSSKCKLCEKIFTSQTKLKIHMESHSKEPVQCQSCGKFLKSKSSLIFHVKNHCKKVPVKSYLLARSQKRYLQKSDDSPSKSDESNPHQLAKIFKKNGPERNHDYFCKCGRKFFGGNAMYRFRQHLVVMNMKPEERIKCEICEKRFKRDVNLAAHMETHVNGSSKCQFCGSTFSGDRALYHHVRDNHANEISSDPEMEEPNDIKIDYKEDALSNYLSLTATRTPSSKTTTTFKTPPKTQTGRSNLDKFKPHKLVNFTKKAPIKGRLPLSIYTCSCGCQFHGKGKNPSATFNNHLKEMKIYPKEMPKCQFCERTFQNKSSLKIHMETHVVKPVECQSCGKTLKGRCSLIDHMRRHCKGVRARKALISSSQNRYKKTSSTPSSSKIPPKSDENLAHQLAEIFNKNGPERNYDYLCKCGHKFFGKNAMYRFNRHLNQKNMKPEDMFKCEICGRCFNRSDTLMSHVESHMKITVKCGRKKGRKIGRHILVISQEEEENNHSDNNLDKSPAHLKVEEPNDIELNFKTDQSSNNLTVTATPTPAEISFKTPPPPPKKTSSPRKRKPVKAAELVESKVHKLAELSKEKGPNGEEKSIYLCSCGGKFANINKRYARNSFFRHLTSMNLKPKEMQKCEICGKRFRQAYDLRIHMQSHYAEPVDCEFCGKTFKGKRVLYVHIRDSCKKARKSKK